LNNAVAALRLSSLPTVAWWRGGEAAALEQLAALVDRVVLDSPDPTDTWKSVAKVATRAAVSDVRWTALTRWRNQMARFFDMIPVRSKAGAMSSLTIVASDRHAARLYAAWITSTLPQGRQVAVTIEDSPGAPIQSITLSGAGIDLRLALSSTGTCIESSVATGRDASASRVVPLGDQRVEMFLGDEVRLQSRDEAFERAIREIAGR
jgi:glucose-6-phosphate dehydrogenase assembly protein OpcA